MLSDILQYFTSLFSPYLLWGRCLNFKKVYPWTALSFVFFDIQNILQPHSIFLKIHLLPMRKNRWRKLFLTVEIEKPMEKFLHLFFHIQTGLKNFHQLIHSHWFKWVEVAGLYNSHWIENKKKKEKKEEALEVHHPTRSRGQEPKTAAMRIFSQGETKIGACGPMTLARP